MFNLRSFVKSVSGSALLRALSACLITLLLGTPGAAHATYTVITFTNVKATGLVNVNCTRAQSPPSGFSFDCGPEFPLNNVVLGNNNAHVEFDFLVHQGDLILAPDSNGYKYIFALTEPRQPGHISDLVTITVPAPFPLNNFPGCEVFEITGCFAGDIVKLDFASGDDFPIPPFITAVLTESARVFIDIGATTRNAQLRQFAIIVAQVPTPATIPLLVGGLILIVIARRRSEARE